MTKIATSDSVNASKTKAVRKTRQLKRVTRNMVKKSDYDRLERATKQSISATLSFFSNDKLKWDIVGTTEKKYEIELKPLTQTQLADINLNKTTHPKYCTCPDAEFSRMTYCKHFQHVLLSIGLDTSFLEKVKKEGMTSSVFSEINNKTLDDFLKGFDDELNNSSIQC